MEEVPCELGELRLRNRSRNRAGGAPSILSCVVQFFLLEIFRSYMCAKKMQEAVLEGTTSAVVIQAG